VAGEAAAASPVATAARADVVGTEEVLDWVVLVDQPRQAVLARAPR